MSNIHGLKIREVLVLLMTLCQHFSRSEEKFTCECECVYGQYKPSSPRCPPKRSMPSAPAPYNVRIDMDVPDCLVQNYDEIPECDEYIDGYPPCEDFTNCCLEDTSYDSSSYLYYAGILKCNNGPNKQCAKDDMEDCFVPTAQDCHCEYEYYLVPNDINEQPQNKFAIGLGVGIGICVFVAVIIALLVYCRLQGRREGQEKAQDTLPKGTPPRNDANRQGDNEEYAEIDSYVGDATMRAVSNQAYDSSAVAHLPSQSNQAYTSLNDPAINSHQYKSLKKPNQDLGNGDYADPGKYTEPPVLPQRNSNAIDDEEDDEDYVSQGTPEPATNNVDSRDDYTLETTAPSSDNINSSAQSNPKESPTPSSDYVSVNTPDNPNSISPSSDYVSVDTPDHSSPISPASDYVSVDTSHHPSPISPSNDYISVDSPDNDTEENDISSDYVDF